MKRQIVSLFTFLVIGVSLYACATIQSGYRVPVIHPENIDGEQPVCTNCHDIQDENFPYARYNHTLDFGTKHRVPAFENGQTCRMCHHRKYCSDCHSGRTELKPSDRFIEKSTRRFHHRGDYVTRHRIDGRINPVSCIRCHGTPATTKVCRPCHG